MSLVERQLGACDLHGDRQRDTVQDVVFAVAITRPPRATAARWYWVRMITLGDKQSRRRGRTIIVGGAPGA
jgi:hypothetical protein